MSFLPPALDERTLKNLVSRLHKSLQQKYPSLLRSGTQEHVAHMLGFQHWHEAIMAIKTPAMRENTLAETVQPDPQKPSRLSPAASRLHLPGEEPHLLTQAQSAMAIGGGKGVEKTTSLGAIGRNHVESSHHVVSFVGEPPEFDYYDIDRRENTTVFRTDATQAKGTAPRNSLRRQPSVILMSDPRDVEEIAKNAEASIGGHKVYSTTHSHSAPDSLARVTTRWPAEQCPYRARDWLEPLDLIVVQCLEKCSDGKRHAVREWLALTPEVREEIYAQVMEDQPRDQLHPHLEAILKQHGFSLWQDAMHQVTKGVMGHAVLETLAKLMSHGTKIT